MLVRRNVNGASDALKWRTAPSATDPSLSSGQCNSTEFGIDTRLVADIEVDIRHPLGVSILGVLQHDLQDPLGHSGFMHGRTPLCGGITRSRSPPTPLSRPNSRLDDFARCLAEDIATFDDDAHDVDIVRQVRTQGSPCLDGGWQRCIVRGVEIARDSRLDRQQRPHHTLPVTS